MIKTRIREISQKFGYDFVKTEKYPYGKIINETAMTGGLSFMIRREENISYPKDAKGISLLMP